MKKEALAVAKLKLPQLAQNPSTLGNESNSDTTDDSEGAGSNETSSGRTSSDEIRVEKPVVDLDPAEVSGRTDSQSTHDEL
jgi:hypothetical protein